MSIELSSELVAPERMRQDPLPVKRITFESRKACFRFGTCGRPWEDFAVQFHVGPIGLNLNADEAEAFGKAMIECAEHYRSVAGGAA